MARRKTTRVKNDLIDTETGEILEQEAGLFDNLDKTKPMTDEQYRAVAQLPDQEKRAIMSGFRDTAKWDQKDIERHYQAAHFPEIKYHSSGGGGKGTTSPPKARVR